MKRVAGQDAPLTIAPRLNITRRLEVLFSKFSDGAPLLAVGVREVDGIGSFYPSLLLLIIEL